MNDCTLITGNTQLGYSYPPHFIFIMLLSRGAADLKMIHGSLIGSVVKYIRVLLLFLRSIPIVVH